LLKVSSQLLCLDFAQLVSLGKKTGGHARTPIF